MKKKDRYKDLNALSDERLQEELLHLKRSFLFLQCRRANAPLDKPSEIRALRRTIAQAMTVWHARQQSSAQFVTQGRTQR